MQCDICGKETELLKTSVEGTVLNVCQKCAQFGKVLSVPKPIDQRTAKPIPQKPPEREATQIIVPDYASIVKRARESMGLKQEDFAKKVNEKVSLVHNLESGRFKPSIGLAQKLERFLKVKLIEEYEEKRDVAAKKRNEGLTLGDVLNFK
jgi:putative transcription factor